MDNEEVRLLSEIDHYMQRMDDLRAQIEKLVAQVEPAYLNWRPFGADREQISNSIAVLVAHICGAEHHWLGEIIGGKDPTRDRQAEFATKTSNHSELFQLLHQNSKETREILSVLTTQDLDGNRVVEDKEVPVRWVILHVIEHTALHLGHLQLTYQMLSGKTPNPSPF